jgi:putative glutamine amidotransferase
MRPAIGVTIENPRQEPEVFRLREDYVRSVESAGGLPLIFAPGRPEDAAEVLDRVDGLLLTGGADMDPRYYGETRHPKLGPTFDERDAFELALCREALRRDLPLLAICRGHQVLNVARGGTLVQDIPSVVVAGVDHDARSERWERSHEVRVLQGTRLRGILGGETVAVNSFHHQAVDRLGEGLVASAHSSGDRVIEAIEMPDRRFVVGVQWHPESFWNRPDGFGALFRALVLAATRS